MAIPRFDVNQPGSAEQIAALRAKLAIDGDVVSDAGRRKTVEVFGAPLTPAEVVQRICDDVSQQGLSAVLDYTASLDGKTLTAETLRTPIEEIAEAHAAADRDFLATVRRLRGHIAHFQEAILHRDVTVDLPAGGYLTQRYRPIERAGLCIPGGAAAYPSTLLMTAVPAQAAGVKELAVVAPPTEFGSYNRDLLAVCHELGIDEVYRMGGAQAVAALAYGVDGVPRVDKIVGPGNLFVALAKKYVFGEVDIDSIAGPSEVVVIGDETTRPDYAAADLIAQAEHSPGSSVLISWYEPLLTQTAEEIEKQLADLQRGDLARASLEEFGALILVADRDQAAELANELATEHLHIECEDAADLVEQIRNAGAIFVGQQSPVALGDYAAGPSHVLPTGATARFASGLSSNDFLRSGSVIEFTEKSLARVAADVKAIAEKEGLTAHAASVTRRLGQEE